MEVFLYSIGTAIKPIAIFLIVILTLGIFIYLTTRKFDIHKKAIRYAGLLTGLTNKQILILSAIIIRTFMIIYTACTYEKDIFIYLVMIIIVAIIYIAFVPKKILFESINIIAQVIILYFINILKMYKIEVSDQMYINQVILVLVGFIIVYSIYFLLKNFESLIKHKKKGKKKNEKEKIPK